jgi:hypothetical protein
MIQNFYTEISKPENFYDLLFSTADTMVNINEDADQGFDPVDVMDVIFREMSEAHRIRADKDAADGTDIFQAGVNEAEALFEKMMLHQIALRYWIKAEEENVQNYLNRLVPCLYLEQHSKILEKMKCNAEGMKNPHFAQERLDEILAITVTTCRLN